MVAASQKHRELELISPLGQDVLLLHKFKAVEELGRPYNFELTLRSNKEDIDFESLLGQNVDGGYTLHHFDNGQVGYVPTTIHNVGSGGAAHAGGNSMLNSKLF